jgi:hypothetical protein
MDSDEMVVSQEFLEIRECTSVQFFSTILKMNQGVIREAFQHNDIMNWNTSLQFIINCQKLCVLTVCNWAVH